MFKGNLIAEFNKTDLELRDILERGNPYFLAE